MSKSIRKYPSPHRYASYLLVIKTSRGGELLEKMFSARDDDEAQLIVENEYGDVSPDADGTIQLYKLTFITDWSEV